MEGRRYALEGLRLQAVKERERDFVADQLEPFVARRIRIPDYTSLPPDPEGSQSSPSPPRADLRALLEDSAFASLLALRLQRTRTAIQFGDVVGRILQRVQDRISSELPGG